jgi:hypothetical protein
VSLGVAFICLLISVKSKGCEKGQNYVTKIGKDVAKISNNKLSTLIFDFTFISLHVSTLQDRVPL